MNSNNKENTEYCGIRGDCYNIEELRKNDKETMDDILVSLNVNLQDLDDEINILENAKKDIHTAEVRSILKGIEQCCDEIDDLASDKKQNE